jgi:phosphate acetyltransferase
MKQTILLAPTCKSVSLYTVALGVTKALTDKGLKVAFITPFSHIKNIKEMANQEKSLNDFKTALPTTVIEQLLAKGEEDKILDFVLGFVKEHSCGHDIIVVEGIAYKGGHNYASYLNNLVASALSADVVFITTLGAHLTSHLSDHLNIAAEKFSSIDNKRILGYILNKVGAPVDTYGNIRIDLFDPEDDLSISKESLKNSPFPLLGLIPWKREFMAADIDGITNHLNAKILNKDTYHNNPILHLTLAAATLEFVTPIIKNGVMILTSGDRSDIIIATCMSYLSGIKVAGLILTGGHTPNKNTLKICKSAIDKGLPILLVKTDSLRTAISLQNMETHTTNKKERLDKVRLYIANNINTSWMENLGKGIVSTTMSPAAFRFHLIEKAKKLNKTIVLPEGDDIRILSAANACSKKGIAKIILLGEKEKIHTLCKENGEILDPSIKIINPKTTVNNYVSPLLELRKHKGLTEEQAKQWLDDPIVLGMMMLQKEEVDGLVAGANTTTANVVSPALKILKTAVGAKLVSSIFFMCLENEVIVYGDCAVNPNPTAEGLADIAMQSTASAKKFDIDPKIAMISYSTGASGKGADVEKVKEAVRIIREKNPDLIIDGPLQYDAAKSPEIAKIKAPNSPVAGQATIFIFPDLNTANTTYKAVQRTAGVLSIGPVLQGLRKPVNDLSRGATVEDIIYTIAITAIQ